MTLDCCQLHALDRVREDAQQKADELQIFCTIAVRCHNLEAAHGYAAEWQRWRTAVITILDLQSDLVLLAISDSLAPDAARVEAGS